MAEIKGEMERSVDDIIAAGKPWTDPAFPPNSTSIQDSRIDVSNRNIAINKWERASEIYEQTAVFSGGIDPNDIQQGKLGDCYFLAVLSSLAEKSERI